MTRFAATLLVVMILTLSLAEGGPHPAEAQLKQPSKVADSVQRMLRDIDATAPPPALRQAPVDLSALSSPLVRVSPTGKIELVFHAAGPVGDAEETCKRWAPTSSPGSRPPPA
jgi:hypothetical protein